MSKRPVGGNYVDVGGGVTYGTTIQDQMVLFDSLPRVLRDALNYSAFDWSPLAVRDALQAGAMVFQVPPLIALNDEEAAKRVPMYDEDAQRAAIRGLRRALRLPDDSRRD